MKRKVNRATVSAIERRMCQRLLETRGDPRLRLVLWNGEELRCSDAPPMGRIVLRDRRLIFALALHPDVGLADAYASGRLEIEGDLTAVLKLVFKDERPRTFGLRVREQWALWRRRSRSLRASVENIHSHYDLGNDFYKLWLDERMAYTCAYFPTPTASLEEAQLAKMDHVARKVWLRPGERVVEAGCGWGSLALHMARHYGVHVTAYNISSEQIAWARERALIEAQLAAFASDDANKAYSYAAPGIQTMFGSADRFLAMVRESYPVVYRPASVAFLQPEWIDGKLVQRVQMSDAAGAPWLVVYELERQADHTWRIAGCVAARSQGRST
jgi:hypothetical protein